VLSLLEECFALGLALVLVLEVFVGIEEDDGEFFTDENRDHQDDGDDEETDMTHKQSGTIYSSLV
jgi:hypothetical protein